MTCFHMDTTKLRYWTFLEGQSRKTSGGSASSERVHWLVAGITKAELKESTYEVWHDRTVFHFLTQESDRIAYVRQATRAVKPGGHVIVSTFGPEGPTKCSGLDVMRYDPEALHDEFGNAFRLLKHRTE